MTQTININGYDEYIKPVDWLTEVDLPVAITLTETLESSEGKDAIIFPPTFAVSKTAEHPYQIDLLDAKLTPQEAARCGQEANNCLIDSVGSQANRMESVFKQPPLSELVPQITVKLKDAASVNLLDIGHRVADGAIRFSGLREEVQIAIERLRDKADATLLAKLSPTSLIFGFWDSRPDTTMYKFGRMLSSTIRATNVSYVRRSAQFIPAFDPASLNLGDELPEGETEAQEHTGKAADGKDPLSKLGLRAAPAVNTHGGVRVFGQIIRRTQINLVKLRALAVTKRSQIDEAETLTLRRYILGLALVAVRAQTNYDLRAGCLLRCIQQQAQLVFTTGENRPFEWNNRDVIAYVQQASKKFGVEQPREYSFDPRAVKDGVDTAKRVAKEKASKKNR